ncbi:hypothetical protein GQ55_9G159400 [Panicum hallii var. hallii]|uniref:Uncharacterized protein n=1 Tax=Panicum hallii var. hallii TaxID=1504633 RepID=A0A2T7C3Z7_9POAL|nr:hypothetical protein GQ55_9G159400 [Panicum hallii var. hallii]
MAKSVKHPTKLAVCPKSGAGFPCPRRPRLGGLLVGDAAERDSADAEEMVAGESGIVVGRSQARSALLRSWRVQGRGHQLSWNASRSCHRTAHCRRNPAAQGISQKNLKPVSLWTGG